MLFSRLCADLRLNSYIGFLAVKMTVIWAVIWYDQHFCKGKPAEFIAGCCLILDPYNNFFFFQKSLHRHTKELTALPILLPVTWGGGDTAQQHKQHEEKHRHPQVIHSAGWLPGSIHFHLLFWRIGANQTMQNLQNPLSADNVRI